MEKLVQCIYAYDGDIIKFAGDAIICVFSNNSYYFKSKYSLADNIFSEAEQNLQSNMNVRMAETYSSSVADSEHNFLQSGSGDSNYAAIYNVPQVVPTLLVDKQTPNNKKSNESGAAYGPLKSSGSFELLDDAENPDGNERNSRGEDVRLLHAGLMALPASGNSDGGTSSSSPVATAANRNTSTSTGNNTAVSITPPINTASADAGSTSPSGLGLLPPHLRALDMAAVTAAGAPVVKNNLTPVLENERSLLVGEKQLVPPEIVYRAIECAKKLSRIQTDTLTVHIAMTCGEICFGVLGGHENRWECLISGSCIRELEDCLSESESKQVVISSGCRDSLHHGSSGGISREDLTAMVEEEAEAEQPPIDFLQLVDLQPLASGNCRVNTTATPVKSPPVSLKWRNNSSRSNSSKSDEGEGDGGAKKDQDGGADDEGTGIDGFAAAKTGAGEDGNVPVEVAAISAAKQWTKKQPLKRTNSTSNDILSRFVPPPVESGLVSEGLRYLGEIREVTTMFMKWDLYDPHEMHRDLIALQPCFLVAQKVLFRQGAYLRQFLIDDKGCVLIACWGVPSLSYYDNAYRALCAATEIQSKLGEMGMETSYGITTGDVYCGTVGSDLRMEYAAIGSVVNMAARLMGKAKRRILLDAATHSRLPQSLHDTLLQLDPLTVKGRSVPIHAFEYIGKRVNLLIERQSSRNSFSSGGGGGVESAADKANNGFDADAPEYEIRAICRLEFDALLSKMVKQDTTFQPFQSRTEKIKDWIEMAVSRQGAHKHQRKDISYILLEGSKDTGKTQVAKWLRKRAADFRVPACVVELVKTDQKSEFALWRKMFRRLMPKEMFSNEETQRRYVRTLLAELYPPPPPSSSSSARAGGGGIGSGTGQESTAAAVVADGEEEGANNVYNAIAVMQVALGVTCKAESLRPHQQQQQQQQM
mmetsp:Transcript_491/g.855  ORF Transcript_491/g.855 Transcript_491/m.855 type:complete len:930 (+) Transcript_491:411-3200(+)